jgi:bifunctional DNA-binding transcriptional regulator/antitoxin component of YhaV-PrlF toxin-antitoxin module
MSDLEVRIDRTGRLLIPVAVRRVLALRPGATLLLQMREGGFELLTREAALQRARQLVRRHIPKGAKLTDGLLRERRREVDRD